MTIWDDDYTLGIQIKRITAVWVKGDWCEHPFEIGIEIHKGPHVSFRFWFGYIQIRLKH